jgi:hypothetical protein
MGKQWKPLKASEQGSDRMGSVFWEDHYGSLVVNEEAEGRMDGRLEGRLQQ